MPTIWECPLTISAPSVALDSREDGHRAADDDKVDPEFARTQLDTSLAAAELVLVLVQGDWHCLAVRHCCGNAQQSRRAGVDLYVGRPLRIGQCAPLAVEEQLRKPGVSDFEGPTPHLSRRVDHATVLVRAREICALGRRGSLPSRPGISLRRRNRKRQLQRRQPKARFGRSSA